MPESPDSSLKVAGHPLFPGQAWKLGPHSFSEQEIIDFARVSDPLPFHVDPGAAARSHFGRIVASGPHLFSAFHRLHFIPMFGTSVLAGLAIRNWEFLQPHFPDVKVEALLTLNEVHHKPEKGIAIVHWRYDFHDEAGVPLQKANFEIMHKTDPR
jgi:acyl dehydratase